jgi:hypothetical protein
MKRSTWRWAGLVLAAMLPAAGSVAQVGGLPGKGDQGGALQGIAGMAGAPVASGSLGNVAGLMQYCIGNNYLSGDGASAVKDKLLGKLSEGSHTSDPGYSDGVKGLLRGRDGKAMDLGSGSGGLKAELTKKACDTVLAQAKSFL